MSKVETFLFKINAYTPKTMPMARLAEYITELATLLGEKDKVHFKELVNGSTGVKYIVEPEAVNKVNENLQLVKNNRAPTDVQKAYQAINKKLKDDGGDASISGEGYQNNIIHFPGKKEPSVPVYGQIFQSGSIDGVVIKVGGINETVSVSIQSKNGSVISCKAKRPLVLELVKYLFTQEIRCIGTGKWIRNEEGEWILDSFTITEFEVLDESSLIETVSALRNVKGSGWKEVHNPWRELNNIRGNE